MHDFPHLYEVTAEATATADVELSGKGLASIASAPPAEFGGPGDKWSPETLLVAAVADCFVLSFRAIAQASRFDWDTLECKAQGRLERPGTGTQFTAFTVRPVLTIPADADESKARRLLEKAEHACLITNSLTAPSTLEITVRRSG